MPAGLNAIQPGEILREDFMRPLGLTMNALARGLAVPPNRISAILKGSGAASA